MKILKRFKTHLFATRVLTSLVRLDSIQAQEVVMSLTHIVTHSKKLRATESYNYTSTKTNKQPTNQLPAMTNHRQTTDQLTTGKQPTKYPPANN